MRLGIIDLVIEYQFEVLLRLEKNKGISIAYALMGTEHNFHGDINKIKQIKSSLLSSGMTHDEITDFLFPDEINELVSSPWSISEKMLSDLKSLESIYMRITDRAASIPISIQERKLFYLKLLNYFNNKIIEEKLTHILVFDTPHSFVSIIYYELARYHNLKVIRFEYHFFPNYCVFANSYDLPTVPIDYLKNVNNKKVFSSLPEEINSNLSGSNAYFDAYKKRESKAVIGDGTFAALNLYIRYVIKATQNSIMGVIPFFFKKEILHFTSLNNIKSRFVYRFTANSILRRQINHNLIYNKLAVTPDITSKYIYFGLHMQPEKSTQPLGGEYDNQFLCATLLAQSIPDDWNIYIKEHPNQFNPRKLSNSNYRSKSFYKSLLNIEKVSLVPLSFSSDILISNAQLVATVTGSIGWESLSAGKAVIAFGHAYYKPCQAVGHITDVNQGKREIARLLKLTIDDVKGFFYKYLKYYLENEYLINAANWEKKIQLSDKPREYHIETITKRIEKELELV